MFGKFEIFKSTNLMYYFVLKARNGEIIATSELYRTRSGARKGIAAVKKCLFAAVSDMTWQKSVPYRFSKKQVEKMIEKKEAEL